MWYTFNMQEEKSNTLSEKHDSFCQEFGKDYNATKAAIRAGYSSRTARQQGSRLLSKANIQSRIAELQAETGKRNRIDAGNIIGKLEAVYQGSLTDKRYSAANRAAELQGKLAGLFTDKSELELHGAWGRPASETSEEELDQKIMRLLHILGCVHKDSIPNNSNSQTEV